MISFEWHLCLRTETARNFQLITWYRKCHRFYKHGKNVRLIERCWDKTNVDIDSPGKNFEKKSVVWWRSICVTKLFLLWYLWTEKRQLTFGWQNINTQESWTQLDIFWGCEFFVMNDYHHDRYLNLTQWGWKHFSTKDHGWLPPWRIYNCYSTRLKALF